MRWRGIALLGCLAAVGMGQAAQAAVHVVTSVGDFGRDTLRQAILAANADGQESEIIFEIPRGVQPLIRPLQDLPTIEQPVSILGHGGVEINGEFSQSLFPVGLRLAAPGCVVRGLRFTGWSEAAIDISGGGATIAGCQIGSASAPNWLGIRIESGGNTIGGPQASDRNVISGNAGSGVAVLSGLQNRIMGNRIGTDSTGMSAVPNGVGVEVASPVTFVGWFTPGSGNLISGNIGAGVLLRHPAEECQVVGNVIGLALDGITPLPNQAGVHILDASTCMIGGDTPEARNVISGNTGYGVRMTSDLVGNEGEMNSVSGNHIGTDVGGNVAVPNGIGIRAEYSRFLTVGGGGPAGNLISGNTMGGVNVTLSGSASVVGNRIGVTASGDAPLPNGGSGIELWSADHATVRGNVILGGLQGISIVHGGVLNVQDLEIVIAGNWIGTDPSGALRLGPQESGIMVESQGNRIGGPDAADANVIVNSRGHGIVVGRHDGVMIEGNRIGIGPDGETPMGNAGDGVRVTSSRVTIRGNFIANNGGLGIDLGGDGITQNDPLDQDSGPNALQNFPAVSGVVSSPSDPTFAGTLESGPNAISTVDLYLSERPDPSGWGEGAHPLHSFQVTTDPFGTATINETFAGALPPGRYLTATATDGDGSTSEFSPAHLVAGLTPSAGEIVAHLLGLSPDPGDLDLNASGSVDIGDVVAQVNQ